MTVVTPIFNNEHAIGQLVDRLAYAMSELAGGEWEHLLIDDGSTDMSWQECITIAKKHHHVRAIRLARNYGQQEAVRLGWTLANGKKLLTISADLQDPPELVPTLVNGVEGGWDLSVGQRQNRRDPLTSRVLSRVANAFYVRSIPRYPSGGFDFYCAGDSLATHIIKLNTKRLFMQGELISSAQKIRFFPYTRERRAHGRSQWTQGNKLRKIFWDLFDAVAFPVKWFGLLSFFSVAAAAVYATRVLYTYSVGGSPFEGWTPIILLILVFGSVQLVGLAILVALLRRIILSMDNRSTIMLEDTRAS